MVNKIKNHLLELESEPPEAWDTCKSEIEQKTSLILKITIELTQYLIISFNL